MCFYWNLEFTFILCFFIAVFKELNFYRVCEGYSPLSTFAKIATCSPQQRIGFHRYGGGEANQHVPADLATLRLAYLQSQTIIVTQLVAASTSSIRASRASCWWWLWGWEIVCWLDAFSRCSWLRNFEPRIMDWTICWWFQYMKKEVECAWIWIHLIITT